LRERQGAVIKWAPVDDEGHFLIDAFEKLLSPRTKMVAITHMSNMLGTLVPVKEVVRRAHARGVPVLLDGAQAAVHLDVDVQDIGCDFYAVTGHKLYGPTGIGVLYGKYEHLEAMPPFNGGGEMIREVFEDRIIYGEPPHKFEAGTPPIVQAIGLGAAIDYVNSVGRARIRTHEACARSTRCVSSAPPRTRARSFPSSSRAPIPTMSRPSSTAPASRCAPALIA
jgi:cysteine desulfurase/selenocysteine lyase